MRVYYTVEELARDYGTKMLEKYFSLNPVDIANLERMVAQVKDVEQKNIAASQRKKDEDEFDRLRKKLGK